MGKAELVERTIAIVLSEYTAACAASKANGVPKKARAFENLDLYAECKKLGVAFDELDKAANGKEPPYDVSSEPLVIAANAAILERAKGDDGVAWIAADKANDIAVAAFIVARDAKKLTDSALTIAECTIIGGENVSLPGKGKDGASLAVAFQLTRDDDDNIDVSNGPKRGSGSSTGDIVWAKDAKYRKTFTAAHRLCKAANAKEPKAATLDVTALALGNDGVPNKTRVDALPSWFDGEYAKGKTYAASPSKILTVVGSGNYDARREFQVVA